MINIFKRLLKRRSKVGHYIVWEPGIKINSNPSLIFYEDNRYYYWYTSGWVYRDSLYYGLIHKRQSGYEIRKNI